MTEGSMSGSYYDSAAPHALILAVCFLWYTGAGGRVVGFNGDHLSVGSQDTDRATRATVCVAYAGMSNTCRCLCRLRPLVCATHPLRS